MSRAPLSTVIRHLHKLAGGEQRGGLDDADLLRRFVEARDEAAFEVLVWRHGTMVLNACRRILGGEQDVEDAFQATFLALVREARSISRGQAVAGWLYKVAYRAALRIRARLKRLPVCAGENLDRRPAGAADELGWRDLRPVLDEEVNRLPEKYRVPFVLCYLEGKTNEEAAQQLRCPRGTIATRLAWARGRLRSRLVGRGLTLSAGWIGMELASQAASAALSGGLVAPTVQAALAFAVDKCGTAAVSAKAVSVAEEILRALFLARLKLGAACLLALGLLVAGGAVAVRQTLAAKQAVIQQGQNPPAAAQVDQAPGEKQERGTVVDPAGLPVPNATVWLLGGTYDAPPRVVRRLTTNAAGEFTLARLPDQKALARGERLPSLIARDPQGRLGWLSRLPQDSGINEPIRLRLVHIAQFKGRVVDGNGRPVVAQIAPLWLYWSLRNVRRDFLELFREFTKEYQTDSAADGTFVLRGLPAGGSVIATLTAPGFGSPRISWDGADTATLRLEPAGNVRGAVICDADPRAAGAIKLEIRKIYVEPDARTPFSVGYDASVTTGAGGSFAFNDVPPGKYTVTPVFDEKTPFHAEPTASFEVKPRATVSGIRIPLQPAVQVRGRVVDETSHAGIKDAEVMVHYVSPVGQTSYATHTKTSADGSYSAYLKPNPGKIIVQVSRAPESHLPSSTDQEAPKLDVTGDRALPDIQLERAGRVMGIVIDDIGKPVPRAVVAVVVPNRFAVDDSEITSNARGEFTVTRVAPQDTVPLRARTANAVTDGAVVVTPAELKEPLKLVISPTNAFRLRGMVTDAAGKPIPSATIALEWSRSYVSRRTQMSGLSGGLDKYTADAQGRFETKALWPGDRYRVTASAEGYGTVESIEVVGQRGQVQDLGALVLPRLGFAVKGKVVDSAGRPLAGVRVFNQGDGPQPVQTQTDAAGRFQLHDLYAGPVYVFAEKAGYRFTATRVHSSGGEATVRLPRTGEPRPPGDEPDVVPPVAGQRVLARGLLEELWALPVKQRQAWLYTAVVNMARLDPDQALRWSAEAGGQHAAAVRTTAAEDLAASNVDQALLVLKSLDPGRAFTTLHKLTERYLTSDPARALRFAEEAIVRARQQGQPDRTWSLAEIGTLVSRLGKPAAGRQLIDEAAAMADKLGAEQHQALARGMVAEALAPYDLERALELLKPIKDANDLERYRGFVAAALAPHDLKKALAITTQLSRQSTLPDRVRMRIAYGIAPAQPAEAVRVVEGMDSYNASASKVEGFGWLAVAVAPHDQRLAWSLIDRGIDLLQREPEAFRGWSNYGGRSIFAARLALQAQQVRYPDVQGIVDRALSLRTTGHDESSPARVLESQVATAMILALVDPATARQLLGQLESQAELVGTGHGSIERKHWFQAWTLADPQHALDLFREEMAAHKEDPNWDVWRSGLPDMVELLLTPPPDRARHILERFGPFWFPGEE